MATLIEILSSPWESFTGAVSNSDAVQALKTQAQNWAKRVVELYNTPTPSQLQEEKNKLLATAKTIKQAIEKIFGNVLPDLNNTLGALPLLIPLAVVAGAAAAITKWTYDYLSFNQKIAEYNKMVSSGVPQSTAAKLTDQITTAANTGGLFSNVAKIAPWLGVGLLALIFKDKLK